MYKSNNLEAYHLINDEGSSFLYEGKVEYSEGELFKDGQGRTYYPVTTDIGGLSKYYVEVEPEGRPIPATADKKAPGISDLVMASPREAPDIPEPQSAGSPEPGPAQPWHAEEMSPAGKADSCFESPEDHAMHPEVPNEADHALPAIADEPGAIQPSTATEAQAAVKAMASLGAHKPHKKRKIFALPIIIGLVLIAAVIVATGVYIYDRDIVSGLGLPFIAQPSPTPTPTLATEPTEVPQPTITPQPTSARLPGNDIYKILWAIAPAIESNNTSVASFAANNSNPTGTSFSRLAKVCDLFDYVNMKWTMAGDSSDPPQNASESIRTLKGSAKDYSILMAALAESVGMDSRVVAMYDDTNDSYVYYPEVKFASNDSSFYDAKVYLRARYDVSDPFGQFYFPEYWLSLSMGKTPGGRMGSSNGYTVNSRGEIYRI